MKRARVGLVVLGVGVGIAVVACGGDNGTGVRSPVSLAGSYGLDSLYFGPLPVPEDSGSMVLSADSVHANIVVVQSPDTNFIPDNFALPLVGQYQAWHTAAGDSVYFILAPPFSGTFGGTFALRGAQQDTLSLTLLVVLSQQQSVLVGTRWHKK